MDSGRVAHALETIKVSQVFTRHAMRAAEQMAHYREHKNKAIKYSLGGDERRANLEWISARSFRRMAYDIMFPYRQEFKYRAWCRDEMTAETHVALVYGEC